MLLRVAAVFLQSGADAVEHTAVELAGEALSVGNDTDIGDGGDLENGQLAGVDVDFDFADVEDVAPLRMRRVVAADKTGVEARESEVRADVLLGGAPVAVISGGDALGDHLVIGAVGAVGLAHGGQHLVRDLADGVADDVVGTAAAGDAGLRRESGVALDELDLIGGDADVLQSLVSEDEGTDVGALSELLPAVVDGDAVLGELDIGLGLIGRTGGGVAAPGDTDAALLVRGVADLRTGHELLVDGTHLVHHFFHRILEVVVAVQHRLALFARYIDVSEFERVDAGLLGEHVHNDLRRSELLGGAEAAVRCALYVVGVNGTGDSVHVRYIVREAEVTEALPAAVLAGLGVSARVVHDIILESLELAVLIAAEGRVAERRGALAGPELILLPGEDERAGTSGLEHTGNGEGAGAAPYAVAEGSSGEVHDDADIVRRLLEEVGEDPLVAVHILGLALNGDVAFGIHICKRAVRLKDKVRLTLGVCRDVCGVFAGGHYLSGVGSLVERQLEIVVRDALMDLHGAGGNGLESGVVDGQELILDLDLLGGLAGLSLRGGDDAAEYIAVLVDFLVADDRLVSARVPRTRIRDRVREVVIRDVLGGNDVYDAGHLESLGEVDADDVRVADGGCDGGHVEHAGHLHGDVVSVVGKTGDLRQSRGTRIVRAEDLSVFGNLVLNVIHRLLAAHDCSGLHDGVDDLLVACAAAEVVVLCEPVADVLPRGVRVLIEKGLGRYDEARGAEAALQSVEGDERLLQRMQMIGGADTLDSDHRVIVLDSADLLDAGADDLSVVDNGAGAALTDAATDLTAGKTALPDDIGKGVLVGIAKEHAICAIDVEPKFSECHVFLSS